MPQISRSWRDWKKRWEITLTLSRELKPNLNLTPAHYNKNNDNNNNSNNNNLNNSKNNNNNNNNNNNYNNTNNTGIITTITTIIAITTIPIKKQQRNSMHQILF